MASARAGEKVGWCIFYPPRVAIAIKRQGAKAYGWHNRRGTTARMALSVELVAARGGLIDMRAQAEMPSARRPDTPT